MASRGPYSGNSSPARSPDIYPPQYDPFDPPLDPIEMQSYTPSWETRRSAEEPRGRRSTTDIPLVERRSRSAVSLPSDNGADTTPGYAPIPPAGHAPRKSVGAASVHTFGASLNSFGSTLNPFKTNDPDTQALVDRRAGEIAEWRVHWQTPATMLVLFVAGVMGAVGHHLFYMHLNGRPAENQLKMVRYGTALAFFTKAMLVGTVVLSYRQRIWHTFRKKAMTISAIDSLFSATEDPTKFRSFEMVRNAKLATLMAIASWLIPIAAVLSPGSLTSEPKDLHNITFCPRVGTLDFSNESRFNFRNESVFPGSSLIYYNTTDVNGKAPGWFDYYDQPSKISKRLSITAAYLQKPVQNPQASVNNCDNGWNCTYTIHFQGPGYNCEELANSSTPNAQQLNSQGAPFNLTALAPQGNNVYMANVDVGDYADPQVETNDKGEPASGPPYPPLLGVFQTEPVLWIGYSINTSKLYDKSSEYYAKWGGVHVSKIFKCEAYHTNYTVLMNYTDAIQTATILNRTYTSPIVDTDVQPNSRNASQVVATPSSNFVRPNDDVELYKLTATYHAMGSLVRNFLRGTISRETTFQVTKSDISETRLVDTSTSYPIKDLMNQTQSFFEDMIVTLLSDPHLIVASTDGVPCSKTRSINSYVYQARGLWIGYAIAVAIAFVFLLVGAWSIFQNGVASDTLFSRIMVTTRNPTIDRLSVGACLGGDPFPTELRKTKLKFGVLLEDGEGRDGPLGRVEHCTFGTVGETKDIVKHGTYAGLKRWRKDAEEEVGDVEEKDALLHEHWKESL
ncbi:hypothetical protein BU16DRAFT_514951 [Lophium mytilinum]|uniref:Formylmethionine deformylase-like protein n=1 Tax=Lophium mytilinum TaxID=390894 RepID=A0A6A6QIF4_9PEZI|nr:hypothetical protein BU16DRAFT_514951 [Lophium mytilinum]